MKRLFYFIFMFCVGAFLYMIVECSFRGYTFWQMGVLGGTVFLIGSLLNNKFSWKLDLLLQCGIIALMTTTLEAIVGNIDYYFLHIGMWDYSSLPYNFFNGKICLAFSTIWYFFGFIIVFLGDAIDYYILRTEDIQPEYWILGTLIFRFPKRRELC